MQIFDPNRLPVLAMLGVCSYWPISHVIEGVRGVRVLYRKARRRLVARQQERLLVNFRVTGAPF
jgi:hypothetical protein